MTSPPRARATGSCLIVAVLLGAPSQGAGQAPPSSGAEPASGAPAARAPARSAPRASDVLRVIGDTARQKTQREAVEDIRQAEKDLRSSAQEITPSASTGTITRLQARAVRLASQAARLEESDTIGAPTAAGIPEIQSWLDLRQQAALLRTTIQGEAAQVEQADPTRDVALVKGLIASLEQHVSTLRDLSRAADEKLDQIRATYLSSAGLVVSGGVSLGSYQAGFLYYTTQFLWVLGQQLRKLFSVDGNTNPAPVGGFKLVTGASAGSINAFLSAVAGCRRPTADPEKSLFYRAWIPVGTDTLIDPAQVEVDGVLSRKPIEEAASAIERLWTDEGERAGWEACDAYLGISATRLRGRTLSFPEKVAAQVEAGAPSAAMTRLTEKFVLHMVGQPGAPPAVSSFRPHPRDPKAEPPAELYPTLGATGPAQRTQLDDVPARIHDVMTLLQASSSFPFAFPPVELPLTIWTRKDGVAAVAARPGDTAPGPRAPSAWFVGTPEPHVKLVDGGIFDNTPLGLAIHMSEWMPQAPARFVFLVSSNVAWRPPPAPASPPTPTLGADAAPLPSYPGTTFEAYVPFLSDFVSASEDTELMNTVEGHGDIDRELPARQMPVAGEQLGHFLAFVERDFRIFDFYTGMVDAHAHIGAHNAPQLALMPEGGELAIPSPPYACFLAQRRQVDTIALDAIPALPACRDLDRNLIALLQTSTKIRRAAIAQSKAASPPQAGDPLQEFFDTLDQFGYRFRQLAYRGHPATGATAKRAIRDQMQALAHDLAAKQDGEGNELVVSIGAKAVPNLFLYRPPRFYLGVGLDTDTGGEVEQGIELGRLPFASRPALRLTLSERVREMDRSKLDPAEGKFSYAATFMGAAHLMLELPISNVFQLELGGGAAILERIAWLHDPLIWRWGPEGTLRLDFLQRFYLGAGFVYYLDDCAGNNRCSHVLARFQALQGAITSSVYKAWVAVGIRFFWFN